MFLDDYNMIEEKERITDVQFRPTSDWLIVGELKLNPWKCKYPLKLYLP